MYGVGVIDLNYETALRNRLKACDPVLALPSNSLVARHFNRSSSVFLVVEDAASWIEG